MFFPSLVAFMSSSDIIVMVLGKQNAIKEWKELLGPTDSRRAKVHNTINYYYYYIYFIIIIGRGAKVTESLLWSRQYKECPPWQ